MARSQANKDGVRRPGVSHSLERPPSQSPRYLRGTPDGASLLLLWVRASTPRGRPRKRQRIQRGGATSGACRPSPWRRRCPMYPRTACRGQLCGGEELRDHERDALRRARPPGNRLLLPAHPAVAPTGAGDGGAHSPRSARRGQLCGGEGVPGVGKAQALPRSAQSRPSCPLQAVTIIRVQKTSLHNRSSWVASTPFSMVRHRRLNTSSHLCVYWCSRPRAGFFRKNPSHVNFSMGIGQPDSV
jgi:hypothetical protein